MRWTDRRTTILLVILIFLFTAAVIPGLSGFGPDAELFKKWALYIHEQGLKKTYLVNDNPWSPAYQYILWLYGKFCGVDKVIADRIGYLRIFTLAAEILGIYYACLWTNKKPVFSILLLLTLFNIGFSYNTFVWGQMDGMFAAFLFLAIYYLYNNKLVPGLLWFSMAILLKSAGLIFAPVVIFLLWQGHLYKGFSQRFFIATASSAMLVTILCVPFLLLAESRENFATALMGNVGSSKTIIADGACNLYYWVFWQGNGTIAESSNDVLFSGISYYHLGVALCVIAVGIAILPMLLFATQKVLSNGVKPVFPHEKLLIICSLLPFIVFFFSTDMHVQYAHAGIFFLLVYAFGTGDMVAYILFSIAHFLNMEKTMQWLKLENYNTLVFDARFIALLYFIVIVYLFVRLFSVQKPNFIINA